MPVAKPVSSEGRLIAHIDMDCFYVQVEQRKNPELRGLPTAVVQYNSWKGGGLIAVSYEARKFGVKRSMRGDEAKNVCPEIQLVQVPVARGKADLNTYRSAGSEVVSILSRRGRCERASIDEVYLDLTDAAETMLAEGPPESFESIDEEVLKSHVLGLSQDGDVKESVKHWLCRSDADHYDKLLACGAFIVAELRAQVLRETEFTCSAGIAHNKMLAKLASGMNKPAQQTVVPSASVGELLGCLPVKKMKQLGGKLGDSLQRDLGVNTVGDLLQFSDVKLQERYGINTGTWLWNIARGISGEEVEGRTLPKSHGSGKTFPGPRALKTLDLVEHWLNELCEELNERLIADLDQNKRVAHTLTVYARAFKLHDTDSQKKFPSKSCPLRYGIAKIQEDAHCLFQAGLREFLGPYGGMVEKNQKSGWRIAGLSVSASKIVAAPPGTCSIMKFFHSQNPAGPTLVEPPSDKTKSTELPNTVSDADGESSPAIKTKETQFISQLKEGVPDSQELEPERKLQNNQGTCSIMKFFYSQNPAGPTLVEPPSDKTKSAELPNTGSDADGESSPAIKTKETQFISQLKEGVPDSHELEPGRKLQNNQGTCSIMKFFHSQNPAGPTLVEPSGDKTKSDELPNTGSDADAESSPSIQTKETQFVSQLKEGMPDSHELEPERKLQNNQGTRSIIELLQSRAQFRSPLSQPPLQETSCSTMLENASWSGNSRAVPPNKQQKDKPMHSLRSPPVQPEQGRKKLKGTSSILSFLNGIDHSSSGFKLERCGATDESYEPSSSASESVGAATECMQHSREDVQRSEQWSVNPSEIDQSVIDELPPDIQEEVRAWLRPIKQSHTTTSRSRITGYFLPSKDAK